MKRPVWLWMNLLSLDAPLVALVWQDLLERSHPVGLLIVGRLVLGLTVWAIYLADRLLDTRHPADAQRTGRHSFYRENRRTAILLLGCVLAADMWVAAAGLLSAVRFNGLVVGAAVAVYLAIFAYWRLSVRWWKSVSCAALFTIGVFLVAWTRTTEPHRVLLWPAIAFSILCLGNLFLIDQWQPRENKPHGWAVMLLLAAFCIALGRSRWYAAIAASAILMAALDLCIQMFSRDARRVLADVALLTPFLFR